MARPTIKKPTPSADAPETPSATCPVVGIGASAGGLSALEKLLPAIKSNSGFAYVVIFHLDPHYKSNLAEILARHAPIPVVVAADNMAVEADHIYVIPPDAVLTIHACSLHVAPLPAHDHPRTAIDSFLMSLAEDQGEKAACAILSGAGSDGTRGLRAIKEHGGLTLAQADAEYDGMMRSALSTNLVDFVLPAEAIAQKLSAYFNHASRVRAADDEAADYLTQVCTLLRARTGHDFSGYKDRTLVRRIQRRMQVLQFDDIPDFLDRLRKDPQELDLLFQDLLIGVTQFFRDGKSWDVLEENVIARLFDRKGADDTIRVWVPGCSTGEEAYSIAILLREHAPKINGTPKLQIFASDIDENALAIARIGRYPASIANDIPPQRLERYFLREDGTYRIASDLREICLFSAHNLLRDAPFSKLDLITCRNLLIYLGAEVQARIIPLFHYALRENGHLFLGPSENVTRHPRLFGTVDKAHRIFCRRPQIERRLPEFPLTTPDTTRRATSHLPRSNAIDGNVQTLAERMLLDRYAPAYVVVDADGELIQSSGGTGKYLELPAGAPTSSIFNMARRGLRLDLRAALHRAVSTNGVVVQNNITVGTNGGRQTIDLTIQPLRPEKAPDSLYLVVFRDIGGKQAAEEHHVVPGKDVENLNLRQLEAELHLTKERLQTTTEELESSNEELKSGNEELSSMNEELQSANEELETSKEELQSMNEELQTVNSELNSRVEELSHANSDIANLLEATQIATVFLDRDLTVKGFTPTAKDLFHLVESDTGRPIAHVRTRFDNDTIQSDAERVLRNLATIEREVKRTDIDSRYIMRMMPYRTVDNVIAGVVITFSDITKVSEAETQISNLSADLRNRLENLESLLHLVPVGIFVTEDRGGQKILTNGFGAQMLGSSSDGRGLRDAGSGLTLFVADREVPWSEQPLQRAIRTGTPVQGFGARIVLADGRSREVMISATPLFNADGRTRGAISAVSDVSDLKRLEAHREVLVHELRHRVKNILAKVSSLSARMLKTSATVEEFRSAFLSRLLAMGATHELLSAHGWEGADLQAVVALAVKPSIGANPHAVAISGPAIDLTSNASATLGMVFHELAANAAKYGALSTVDGRIAVSWNIVTSDAGFRLMLSWIERDGPAVTAPTNEGFGVSFIKRSIEYELEGDARCDFNAGGFQCHISFPLDRNIEPIRRKGSSDVRELS